MRESSDGFLEELSASMSFLRNSEVVVHHRLFPGSSQEMLGKGISRTKQLQSDGERPGGDTRDLGSSSVRGRDQKRERNTYKRHNNKTQGIPNVELLLIVDSPSRVAWGALSVYNCVELLKT